MFLCPFYPLIYEIHIFPKFWIYDSDFFDFGAFGKFWRLPLLMKVKQRIVIMTWSRKSNFSFQLHFIAIMKDMVFFGWWDRSKSNCRELLLLLKCTCFLDEKLPFLYRSEYNIIHIHDLYRRLTNIHSCFVGNVYINCFHARHL